MAAKLPYMMSSGLIPKILEKIVNARRPERFTQDFLGTKLGHTGGGARPIIPLLKRLQFLGSDGVPTRLYDQFRNSDTQGFAMAEGMKKAFSDLFERNEYVYELSREKLVGQIVEITGATKQDRKTKAIVATFAALNEFADFESEHPESSAVETASEPITASQDSIRDPNLGATSRVDNVDLRLGYTINLNLPETSDPQVFNAIFKALKENLLKN